MLDASLRAELIEVLARSFNSDEISEIGRLTVRKFDLHRLTERHRHVTVPVRDAAQTLVEEVEEKKKIADLIQLVVEADGALLMNRRVEVKGLEPLLANLARAGYVYDFSRRKLRESGRDPEEMANWGALREGRMYDIVVASVDIVGSSELVRVVGHEAMERFYYQFWSFLRRRLSHHDGRIWSWAGDGGIIAFSMKGKEVRAVQWALETQASIPVFNIRPENPIPQPISVRIGMDVGSLRFYNDTGRIILETLNYAAHLEKMGTEPGHVAISAMLCEALPDSIKQVFGSAGDFEGRTAHTTVRRPDGWMHESFDSALSGSAAREQVVENLDE